MKILITSDWHLRVAYKDREIRLEDCINNVEHLIEFTEKTAPDYFFFLGDLFHTLSAFIHKDLLTFARNSLRKLQRICPVYLLCGNHDMFNGKVYIQFLEDTNVKVVSSPTSFKLKDLTVTMIPYSKQYEEIEALIKSMPADIVCLHTDILGADYGHEMSDKGIRAEGYDCKWIFNGHFHKPQKVGEIVCVGSPWQQDAGEAEEEKRVILWEDGKTMDVCLDFPEFHVIDIATRKDLKNLELNKRDYYILRIRQPIPEHLLPEGEKVFIEWVKNTLSDSALPDYSSITTEEDAIREYIMQMDTEDEMKSTILERTLGIWRRVQ